MPNSSWSPPTRRPLPIILIRGFGGLDVKDEKRVAYQGFNDGTVYPTKRGENYIYEGLILRFLKSNWGYQDATNIVGYYANPQKKPDLGPNLSGKLKELDEKGFFEGRVLIDPAMARSLLESESRNQTLWVFRYYDLDDRKFQAYGEALVQLIDFIRELAMVKDSPAPKVNIIAHSMGGLLVREAIQRTYPSQERHAHEFINKVVTLGTPHQGISFQLLKNWIGIEAEDELKHFNPKFQEDASQDTAYVNLHRYFPLERFLTVVGTNYRTYDTKAATWANRFFSVAGEFGMNYNRSDGLVKQAFAQIPGAPRTFIHKCHGGFDSLVTSREAFEVAARFFFGNTRVRLLLDKALVTRGQDWFGRSEFFFGVSVKPRRVDFDLFHQSAEAENCYGPFAKADLSDDPKGLAFGWAAADRRLVWEGYLDTSAILQDQSKATKDLVFRLDFYVGERDLFGVGFSDNIIFRKQYYVRAVLSPDFGLYLHPDESFAKKDFQPAKKDLMKAVKGGWEFDVGGTGFTGTMRIEVDTVPEDDWPKAIAP